MPTWAIGDGHQWPRSAIAWVIIKTFPACAALLLARTRPGRLLLVHWSRACTSLRTKHTLLRTFGWVWGTLEVLTHFNTQFYEFYVSPFSGFHRKVVCSHVCRKYAETLHHITTQASATLQPVLRNNFVSYLIQGVF